jgi:hypothetical protein
MFGPMDKTNLSAEMAAAAAELFRKYQGFADAVAVPDGATAFDRALGQSGRDPDWEKPS